MGGRKGGEGREGAKESKVDFISVNLFVNKTIHLQAY